ncbi:hypothetical protein [Chryseobacterium sp. c4a]|uniref:hypothetical protein n=1 Tax=Chryseobacterium sp. c4a TaxID=1573582 RepID=UPI00135A2C95|nr:hypothetical protein [Chryseobacterium sp. c4a]
MLARRLEAGRGKLWEFGQGHSVIFTNEVMLARRLEAGRGKLREFGQGHSVIFTNEVMLVGSWRLEEVSYGSLDKGILLFLPMRLC